MKTENVEYKEFMSIIKDAVISNLNLQDYSEIKLDKIMKNNEVEQDVLIITKHTNNCAPVIYIEELYAMYQNGYSIEEIIKIVINGYLEHCDDFSELDMNWFKNFEHLKDKIYMKVINYEKNKKRIENCPYIRTLDLVIIFQIMVENSEDQTGTVLIRKEMLDMWEVSEFDLFNYAVTNMKDMYCIVFEPLHSFLCRCEKDDSDIQNMEHEYGIEMYLLSNQYTLNGATIPFYTNILRDIAKEKQTDLFILPSSIHEMIIIPAKEDFSAWTFRQMVEEINEQLVIEEEILSNHVYRFILSEDKLIIAA